MKAPEIDREYKFVRYREGGYDLALFTRFIDDRAILLGVGDRAGPIVFDNSPDAWEKALRYLQTLGYAEIKQAITLGIISKEEADQVIFQAS